MQNLLKELENRKRKEENKIKIRKGPAEPIQPSMESSPRSTRNLPRIGTIPISLSPLIGGTPLSGASLTSSRRPRSRYWRDPGHDLPTSPTSSEHQQRPRNPLLLLSFSPLTLKAEAPPGRVDSSPEIHVSAAILPSIRPIQ
jgi:hypothetical protein